MHPELFSFGGFTLYVYGLMMALGIAAGLVVAAKRAPKFGFTSDNVWDGVLPIVAGGLIGAKLLFLATNWEEYARSPVSILSSLRGGFVYYGSVIGGFVGGIAWLRWRKLPVLPYCDLAAPSLALGQAVGRLGCFFNGCCYGGPVLGGLVFPSLGDGIPRHPVQLYEAAGTLLICLILLRMRPRPAGQAGGIMGWYLASYGLLRFLLEMLRADPRGPVLAGGLSVSQFLSAVGVAAGVYLLLRTRRPAAKA